MSLSSRRRRCSSSPTLAGLTAAQPLVGHRVSSAACVAAFPPKSSAVEARTMIPVKAASMPRFFIVAPSEHLMAGKDGCQADLPELTGSRGMSLSYNALGLEQHAKLNRPLMSLKSGYSGTYPWLTTDEHELDDFRDSCAVGTAPGVHKLRWFQPVGHRLTIS